MAKCKEALSKKELRGLWNRYMWSYNSQGNYARFHGIGYVFSLIPLFKKYYDKEGQIEGMKRHAGFFNSEMQLGSVLFGITVGLEEQKALGREMDDEVITSTKLGLMGPIAGIGDSMIPGVLIPILLSIAIGMSQGGSVLGPIFYIVAYTAIIVIGSYYLFMKGYHMGVGAIDLLMGERAGRIRDAIILIGVTVMGAVAAGNISLSTALQIPSGAESIPLQAMIDGIFPKLLPLLLVLGVYALMRKKKLSSLTMILILMAACFVCAFFGIF